MHARVLSCCIVTLRKNVEICLSMLYVIYMKRILGEKRATREGLVISSTRLRERRGFLTLLIINCRNFAGYFDATYNQVAWEDIADE